MKRHASSGSRNGPVDVVEGVVERHGCEAHDVWLAHVADDTALLQRLEHGLYAAPKQHCRRRAKEEIER